MATKKDFDSNGKFKKGNRANPKGAAAHSPVKRQFKKLTEAQLKEMMNLILFTPPEQLQAEVDKNPSVLKSWIASAAAKGLQKGDIGPLLQILERVVGKVKDVSEVEHKGIIKNIEIEVVETKTKDT